MFKDKNVTDETDIELKTQITTFGRQISKGSGSADIVVNSVAFLIAIVVLSGVILIGSKLVTEISDAKVGIIKKVGDIPAYLLMIFAGIMMGWYLLANVFRSTND